MEELECRGRGDGIRLGYDVVEMVLANQDGWGELRGGQMAHHAPMA